MTDRTVVGGVEITHPDRVLFPDAAITKLDLARYYERVQHLVLPQIAGRPLSVVRCPEGLDREAIRHGVHQAGRSDTRCFFQKHAKSSTPPAVRRARVPESLGSAVYLMVDDLAGLVTLVQFGTLELHPWGARVDRPDCPDRMTFDLDPGPDVAWPGLLRAAQEIRELLGGLGLESFLKTTGGKGLHVVVPLSRRHSWDEVRSFSRAVAAFLSRRRPGTYVTTMKKSERQGRIYVDYLRNVRGATAVAAYSTRARPGAPVSAPIDWCELDPRRRPQFTVRDAGALAARADPWALLASSSRQSITRKMRAMLGA